MSCEQQRLLLPLEPWSVVSISAVAVVKTHYSANTAGGELIRLHCTPWWPHKQEDVLLGSVKERAAALLVRHLETSVLTGQDYLLSHFAPQPSGTWVAQTNPASGQARNHHGEELKTNGSLVLATCITSGMAYAPSYTVGHILGGNLQSSIFLTRDRCTYLQPIIQFALIFQTKSQTTHRQTYGCQVTFWFTWLRRGLRSCCQVWTTFVCSTALPHCLNQYMLWRRPQWFLEQQVLPHRWSLPLVHICTGAAALTAPDSIILEMSCSHALHLQCPCEASQGKTQRSRSYTHCRNSDKSRRTYWTLSPPIPPLFPGCQSCRVNPTVLYKFIQQYYTTFI